MTSGNADVVLLYCPNHAPTAVAPVTEIDGERHITWDRPVKAVPAHAAKSMLRSGGFCEALLPATVALRYGLAPEAVADSMHSGMLTTSELSGRGAGGSVVVSPVVVLDRATLRVLRTMRQAAAGVAIATEAATSDPAESAPTPRPRRRAQ